jgi:hypothetical protein
MHRRQFLTSAAIAATVFAVAPSFAADTAQSAVEAYLAAWNAHDSAKAAEYFADDVTYYDASVGKPVNGEEAAKTGVIDNFLGRSRRRLTMKGAPVVEGARRVRIEFSGTNTGAWADGTAATGKNSQPQRLDDQGRQDRNPERLLWRIASTAAWPDVGGAPRWHPFSRWGEGMREKVRPPSAAALDDAIDVPQAGARHDIGPSPCPIWRARRSCRSWRRTPQLSEAFDLVM